MSVNALYDKPSVMYVLGALLKDTSLLTRTKYNLNESDFLGIHKIIFAAIENLLREGFQNLEAQQVDVYLKQYPNKYEIYNKDGGIDYLRNIIKLVEFKFVDVEFDYYYNTVKKFSILRNLNKSGINTDHIYNPNVDLLKIQAEREKLNKLTIKDLFDSIKGKVAVVEDKTVGRTLNKEQKVAEHLDDLMKELKAGQQIGDRLQGEMFDYAAKGARLGKIILYSSPSGHGKALPNNTLIPTFNDTFKKVGEIKEGDFLIDRKGNPTKVLRTFPQGKKDVYEIIFEDGRTALCNNEHLWTFHYEGSEDHTMQTKTLQEIIDLVGKEGYQNEQGVYRVKVPLNDAVKYNYKNLKIDPYLLGLVLGDRSFKDWNKNNNLTFSASKILKDYPELINNHLHKKFIPKEYLYSSVEQRKNLLQGLLDSSGLIYKNKIRYTTTNEVLKNQFIEICYSLGYTVSVEVSNIEGTVYTIQINTSLSESKTLFRLKRKINQFNSSEDNKKYNFNAIVSIKKQNYQEEMTCFLVDNNEHLFLMNDYIVTHNTRFLVGNACGLSMPYIENDEVIIKENLQKVVFIATEMDPDEIQTLVLAWVSGVDEEKILENTYNQHEEILIKNAIDIIKEYSENFIIEKISDPSVSTIKTKLTRYVVQDDIYYIFYDYIFMSPALRKEFGNGQRDDVLLMMMANTLKEIASDHNVAVLTGTQVNREWEKRFFRNENVIAGSKAVADKIDFGVVATRITNKEKEDIQELLQADGIYQTPNIVIDIYKNRRGKTTNAKLFRDFDYGTCRTTDLIMTDLSYNKIHGIGTIKSNYIKRRLKYQEESKNV